MRKRWAQQLAAFTGALLVLLAVAFAAIQNPGHNRLENPPTPVAEDKLGTDQPTATAGKQVYDAQGCARCHSIAGQGSARSPLDGVGGRLGATEIRQWITAAPDLKNMMPARVFQTKQIYQELPSDDLDALVAYLSGI